MAPSPGHAGTSSAGNAPTGYIIVSGRHRDGTRFCTTANNIVCETFHGPCPPGKQSAHENGDPSDNRPENLSWKTPVGNMADRHRHGTNGRKLTSEQVAEIRTGLTLGETRNALAARYGVSRGMISHIKTRHSWHAGHRKGR